MRSLRLLLAAAMIVSPGTVLGQNVLNGQDLCLTRPGISYQNFLGPFAIPGDFFAPGSDPFTGHVPLKGVPLVLPPTCPAPIGTTEIIFRRPNTAVVPAIPSTDIIPIELVSLSLVSVNPITVTYGGGFNPELWDLKVHVSSAQPSTGTMTITKQHPTGGVFSSTLYVHPVFVFVRQSDLTTRIIDGGLPPLLFDNWTIVSAPWSYDSGPLECDVAACTSNFFPGVLPGYTLQGYTAQGQYSALGMLPACASGPVPVESRTWGHVKALYR